MKYFIDLSSGVATVYTQATKPEDVAHQWKIGASPEEAVRRLLAEDYNRKAEIRSADSVRFGVWNVSYRLK